MTATLTFLIALPILLALTIGGFFVAAADTARRLYEADNGDQPFFIPSDKEHH